MGPKCPQCPRKHVIKQFCAGIGTTGHKSTGYAYLNKAKFCQTDRFLEEYSRLAIRKDGILFTFVTMLKYPNEVRTYFYLKLLYF